MFSTLSYSEMNQAVPGSALSPRMDVHLECQVPSPSQWSDPSRSPPSFHSPTHFPADLDKHKESSCMPQTDLFQVQYKQEFEKIKEEPYSPLSFNSQVWQPYQQMNTDPLVETSIDLAELLEENSSLISQVRDRQHQATAVPKVSTTVDEGFLDSLIEIKQEVKEENVFAECTVSSTTSTPIVPTVSTPVSFASSQYLIDSLRTVELLALDHCRQDVEMVSNKLNIPKEPVAWSPTHVRSWMEYEAAVLGIPVPKFPSWIWTGLDIISLSETQFREWIPRGGELYFAKLEIWREALRSRTVKPTTSNSSVYQNVTTLSLPSTQFSVSESTCVTAASQVVSTTSGLVTTTQPLSVVVKAEVLDHHCLPDSILHTPTSLGLSSFSLQQMSSTTDILQTQVPTTVLKIEKDLQDIPDSSKICSLPTSSCSSTRLVDTFIADTIDITPLMEATPSSSITSNPGPSNRTQPEDEDEAENGSTTSTTRSGSSHIHLWQFLKELLHHPQLYGSCIRWVDRAKGVFKIEDSVRVARLWGKRKNRPAMNYDKLSRSIRQYYRKGIMKKTERSQRLVYQFCHPYNL